MLPQLVGSGGVFTRQNLQQINANFAALSQPDLWVRPQNGNNDNPGTYDKPLATMAGTVKYLKPGMVIGLLGVLFEEVVFPNVNDVTIRGMANTPRQATTSGVPNGGGATWLSPASGAVVGAYLASVGGQGWSFENIYFNASGETSGGCVVLNRDGDPPLGKDASHASFLNCRFTGANFGIGDNGGCGFVTVDGCDFFNFTGSGDTGIKGVSVAQAVPLNWKIRNSNFWNNVNHVVIALSSGRIDNNNFTVIGSSLTTTIALSLTGGKNNSVFNNMFNRPLNTSPNATLFVGGTADVWSENYGSDAIFFGVPDNA